MDHGQQQLVDTAGFSLLGEALGRDVRDALRTALTAGAIFPKGTDPISIYRAALSDSVRDIEHHPRGLLFLKFLAKGPYVDAGPIPRLLRKNYLSDREVASVTAFIHAFMVNSFKGAVAELLAAGAAARLVRRLRREGLIRRNARLFVGDAVLARGVTGGGWRKSADLHILTDGDKVSARIAVAGVAEVKSYFRSEQRLREQLDQHIHRASLGLRVGRAVWPAGKVRLGSGKTGRVVRIIVAPSDWTLPRSFRFRKHGDGRRLYVSPASPPRESDSITQTAADEWRITLRWSKESLAEAAYETTFWYMGKVGEVLYSDPKNKPKEWDEMKAAEAGRNAAKMMLYYAILRCRTAREEQRAIALYNAYGFGYALGMNYRNAAGRREMLWPQDLDEITRGGKTRDGCRIV
ncbi:MAG: hypothetical protein HQ559_13925 [Lentisphaerae bacterium]|nr:hypothetical protein [Lentisphaerota bacterium]